MCCQRALIVKEINDNEEATFFLANVYNLHSQLIASSGHCIALLCSTHTASDRPRCGTCDMCSNRPHAWYCMRCGQNSSWLVCCHADGQSNISVKSNWAEASHRRRIQYLYNGLHVRSQCTLHLPILYNGQWAATCYPTNVPLPFRGGSEVLDPPLPSQIIMTKGGILDDAWHSNVAAADEHFVYMLNRMAIWKVFITFISYSMT